MAELDNIPQKQTIEIEIAKLDESVVKTITELNQKSNTLIADFGSIYIRKKEIAEELEKLDAILEDAEAQFKSVNAELKEIVDALDEKYPQGRINLQDGMIQYQPGALSRKQLAEQQAQQAKQPQQSGGSGMKVVKE
jgi:seryl-tRNA synthetase